MCAINGFDFADQKLILKMNAITKHRGPDDSGFYVGNNISLGHNRLSIIDLSKQGRQPLWNKDETKCIVFNGEIYNFRELKKELESTGYVFYSKTDTEVVLSLFEEFGEKCLEKLNGIFAFAILDTQSGELFLARDRLGIKPLYYYHKAGKFIFSSEIKAIFEHNVKREVNLESFNHFFRLRYVPAPLTMFNNIFKLPAGHFAKFSNGNLEIRKYWDIEDFENLDCSRQEIVQKINFLMKDSVKRQLISDRPVGVFLSGGIDSTSVLGIADEVLGGEVKTYSIGFDISVESEKFNADFKIARRTGKYYKTDHHEFLFSEKNFLENIDDAVFFNDEPLADPIRVVNLFLAKEAKKDVAVVLGGDGGDELFGGYRRYYLSTLIDTFQGFPSLAQKPLLFLIKNFSKNKTAIEKLKLPLGHKRYLAFMIQKNDVLERVLKKDFFQENLVDSFFEKNYQNCLLTKDSAKQMMYYDVKNWLLEESLMRTDRMTMGHGLEGRVPILDHRLVELAFKIPTSLKIKNRHGGKDIFKEAMEDYLPKYVLNQPKRGWFSPSAKWLRFGLKDFAYEILSENYNSETVKYFNFDSIKKILDDHISKKEYNATIIWMLISFQLWHKKFIK
ncbi:asparagine synthase (glutamine-hydrolyzing) [Patescibacteria group bacterium]